MKKILSLTLIATIGIMAIGCSGGESDPAASQPEVKMQGAPAAAGAPSGGGAVSGPAAPEAPVTTG